MRKKKRPVVVWVSIGVLGIAIVAVVGYWYKTRPTSARARWIADRQTPPTTKDCARSLTAEPCRQVLQTARKLVKVTRTYDPSYVGLTYPGGDVPAAQGVCSDVVIRSFRAAGKDLQQLVHEDMRGSFANYPPLWGLERPDPNIDHRRVPNLMVWFERNACSLPRSRDANLFEACDVVAWDLGNGLTHIGLVSDRTSDQGIRLVIHHLGKQPLEEDVLFRWRIIGHYAF
jgi:uncharacterized protein YijF (DUF1287 family)